MSCPRPMTWPVAHHIGGRSWTLVRRAARWYESRCCFAGGLGYSPRWCAYSRHALFSLGRTTIKTNGEWTRQGLIRFFSISVRTSNFTTRIALLRPRSGISVYLPFAVLRDGSSRPLDCMTQAARGRWLLQRLILSLMSAIPFARSSYLLFFQPNSMRWKRPITIDRWKRGD